MGANFGKNYQISLFGESHGVALGINIDGIPAGTQLDIDFIKEEIKNSGKGMAPDAASPFFRSSCYAKI